MNSFCNISGYRFIQLDDLASLRDHMHGALLAHGVLGTILLAEEGINVALVGSEEAIQQSRAWFDADARFAGMDLKLSLSSFSPFSKLKVKVRPEIITFAQSESGIDPQNKPGKRLSVADLKQWLDEGRDFCLLDSRNTYEIESGTFEQAQSLEIENFRDLPAAVDKAVKTGDLDPAKPMVTFCTGGVRCEKTAPWLEAQGFSEVYQLDGGILRYFEECEGAHWRGDCFVFDDRVEITPQLAETGAVICRCCHKAVSQRHQHVPHYKENEYCPACKDDSQRLRSGSSGQA